MKFKKITLKENGRVEEEIPKGSTILPTVFIQYGKPRIVALTTSSEEITTMEFVCFTLSDQPNVVGWKYLDTFIDNEGTVQVLYSKKVS